MILSCFSSNRPSARYWLAELKTLGLHCSVMKAACTKQTKQLAAKSYYKLGWILKLTFKCTILEQTTTLVSKVSDLEPLHSEG